LTSNLVPGKPNPPTNAKEDRYLPTIGRQDESHPGKNFANFLARSVVKPEEGSSSAARITTSPIAALFFI
jgi:hypothetical protein